MARYKPYDYAQMKFVPVSFAEQILPGTFEHTLAELIDHDVDMRVFEAHYRNDETGAPAIDPAILLKIVLFAYSRGITSSRRIAQLCRENVVFMALSADTAPHFTTVADFVSRLGEQIIAVFRDVLLVCDEMGLIGREMFAVDGVKLPSNAAKEWSGTRDDFAKKVLKIERALRYLLARQREADACGADEDIGAARARQIETLRAARAKVKRFVADMQDKLGAHGRVKKSNITDNASAKIKTAKGVIQGYDAMAVVDAKHQIVVQAAAFGEAQEHGLLVPMLEATRATFRHAGLDEDVLRTAAVSADAGLHSEANLAYLAETGVEAYVADTLFRQRDPRFATAPRHKPPSRAQHFLPRDFTFDAQTHTCICPAGQFLYANGRRCLIGGREAVKFTGAARVCGPCALRAQCLRHPQRTPTRQVVFFTGRSANRPETFTARMKRKIDSEQGRYQYSRRLGTVEPVFADICHAKGLKRFSLRGRTKVNGQWLLFCLVHNIGKIQRYGKRNPHKDHAGR